MNISTTYLLNVALHAAILSVFASLVLLALRQARHRSVAAIAGLLTVGCLPWLTALRPAQPVTAPAAEIKTSEAPALPTWTVVTLPVQQSAIPTPAGHAAAPATFAFPDPLSTFTSIWAAGTGVGLLLLAIASLKVHVWRKSLQPLDATAWQTLLSYAPQIPARNRFLVSGTIASPCVTGFFLPRIVLPKFLMGSGSEEELRWAVRHEIAHWQAGDSRWMILFALIRCANWWNPFVHRLVAMWSDAREQLCDLAAAGDFHTRANYGEFLIAMARRITSRPPLTVTMAKRAHALRLKRRIVSLLDATTNSEKSVGKSFIAISSAGFIACATIVSSVKINAEEPAKENDAAPETEIVGNQTEDQPTGEPPPAPQVLEDRPAALPEKPAPLVVAERSRLLLRITSKLLMTSKRSAVEGGAVLNDPEFQLFMRNAAQTKGVGLMTAPAVALKYGHSGIIEVIWEIPGTPAQVAARDPKSPLPFTGIRFETKADLIDDQIDLKFDADYRFFPGSRQPMEEIASKHPPGTDPDKIKIVKNVITARMSAGQTLCSDLGEIEPGSFLQVFTTVTPLDETGRSLDSFKDGKLLPVKKVDTSHPAPHSNIDKPSGPVPSGKVHGKLRLSGVLVELPLKSGHSLGDEVPRRLVPSTTEAADVMRKAPGANVRKLKTAEIPLNESGTPWPEFPGLNVSAIASRDFKLITISSHAVVDGAEGLPNTWKYMRAGSTMTFGIKASDSKIERRLLIKIEAVK